MESIISKTPVPNEPGTFIIQRVKNGNFEIMKESTSTTGEVPNMDNPLVTVETITITRTIGEITQF